MSKPHEPNGEVGSEEWMTVPEAAKYLGVHRSKIYRLIKEGELKFAGKNPLDKRQSVLKRSDIEALAKRAPKEAA